LITIAKRKCIDEHRATTRRPRPVGEISDASSAGEESMQKDDALWAALQALPMRQREAVAYHHLAGLPYAQVGEILGNSEAAARRAAADGLKKLRAAYRDEVQGVVG
jgi:RNA polymerase sigma factor (sigma-70 family)